MPAQKYIPYSRQWIDEDDIEAVNKVLRSDFITQGKEIAKFEAFLCAATGAQHAVAVSSGTAALHLLCTAYGLQHPQSLSGVTSPITFAASANCMLHCGVRLDFADVDATTGMLLPETCPQADIGIPVSFAGCVAPLAAVRTKFIYTVEDAAHSLGAEYAVGHQLFKSGCCMHSDAAILSFHPVKHICSGEGGAALTNDAALAEELRRLRSHAIVRTAEGPEWHYDQIGLGFHYRLTDFQAALGISQLQKLPFFLQQRKALAKRYCEIMRQSLFTEHIRFAPYNEHSAYHLFVIHFRDPSIRDNAHGFLKERGVGTQVHYKPVYQHTYYREQLGMIQRPGAEAFFAGCLSIPLYPKMQEADQDYVIDQVAEFLNSLRA